MLRYFYERTKESTAYLFKDKKIRQYPDIFAEQGKFPVIYLSFKAVKDADTWAVAFEMLTEQIASEYERHRYLLNANVLTSEQKKIYKKILSASATPARYTSSLKKPSAYLTAYYGEKTVVLIDEYDSPIHAGLLNGYYKKVTPFIRGLLGELFKDNDANLERGVITGILRTAKEGIFSGLNNLSVLSLNGGASCRQIWFYPG